jgi:hypothetical protein
MLGFVLGHKSPPLAHNRAKDFVFGNGFPRFSVWTADELFRAEEFAIASAAAELSGPKHRDRHGPRGAKMREGLRFLCLSALISINVELRFGDLTWEATRVDYANPPMGGFLTSCLLHE